MFYRISITIIALVVMFLAGYGLITGNHQWQPMMMLFLGLMMLVSGLHEVFENKRKGFGYVYIIVAIFVFTSVIIDIAS